MTPSLPLRSPAEQERQSAWHRGSRPRRSLANHPARQTSVLDRRLAVSVQLLVAEHCRSHWLGVIVPRFAVSSPLAAVAESGDQFEHGVKRGFERLGVAFDLCEEQAAL